MMTIMAVGLLEVGHDQVVEEIIVGALQIQQTHKTAGPI